MKETPRSIARRKAEGFSTAWRRGGDPSAYARNYDNIFRKKPEVDQAIERLAGDPMFRMLTGMGADVHIVRKEGEEKP